MPGVQYPHCTAPSSTNAFCSGCSSPRRARPSMVATSDPSASFASTRHAFTARPSMCTVHAPHSPWSQPRLVPVSPSSSRSTSSSVRFGRTLTRYGSPLTISPISTARPPALGSVEGLDRLP